MIYFGHIFGRSFFSSLLKIEDFFVSQIYQYIVICIKDTGQVENKFGGLSTKELRPLIEVKGQIYINETQWCLWGHTTIVSQTQLV